MTGKRFSKNMIRRLAMSGDVANAYALGRTMQEKHNHAVNASAVQVYGDGTRLHTLKSGSYRRLYATGGGARLYQQAGSMIFPWQMHFVIDAKKQCYFIGAHPGGGVASNWTPVLEGVKMRAVIPEFAFTLFLAEDGRLWGIGGWNEAGWAVGNAFDLEVWPPARITPFDDWEIVATENSEAVIGVRKNGTLWLWGNDDAQLGGGPVSHETPLNMLPDITDWVWCDHFLYQNTAVRGNKDLWIWGDVIDQTFGEAPEKLMELSRAEMTLLQNWPYKLQYAPNTFYALAIFEDGRLYYAGRVDIYGPPGLNTEVWTPVSDKNDWWFVEARDIRPAFAVDKQGDLYAYGDLLSTDDSFNHATGWGEFIIGDVQQLTLYDRTAIVLKNDGTLWGWGESDDGELGSVTPIVYPPRQLADVNGLSSDWAWVDIHNYTVIAAKKNGDRYWSGFMGRNTPAGIATNTVITTLIPIDPNDSSWVGGMQYREER